MYPTKVSPESFSNRIFSLGMSETPDENASDYVSDTIVAAATPPGAGGIGIVRMSGPETEGVARAMLGQLPPPRRATFVSMTDANGGAIDRGLALYFPAPHSFTGESVLELHGHGGPVVLSMLVDAAIDLGCRQALPGEFSKRAFLNDKLDLLQAEAIADLIGSGTAQAARAAMRSLSGSFSSAVTALQEQLVKLRVHVEAAIDFPEEELDFLADDDLKKRIEECADAFLELKNRARIGRLLRDGYQIVIVGAPNVGKSSLLNLLSGQDAAIVTEIAGTTRDVLRERIDIDGMTVELIDTAGLRSNPDQVEAEGIRRARAAILTADAVLWVQDASLDIPEDHGEELPAEIPRIIVRNKIDLTGEKAGAANEITINLSAKTGAGVEQLRERIRSVAGFKDLGEGAFTARRRHLDALKRAATHFAIGHRALQESKAGELLAEELRLAQKALGEITGEFTSDDLLGRIFSEFCIGK